ncbi:hypothetical protein [Sphingobacterium multivorum]|uniref:hypothetical protein n=1 Tax=Sphingobacterium multivorum TaxID=28454 RepID=UPI0036B97E00
MKGRNEVMFSLQWFHDVSIDDKIFNRLYNEWVNSGYDKMKKPSLDRINRKYPYTVKNIQWKTWSENRYKQNMERRIRKGKVCKMLNGVVISIYSCQKEAIQKCGVSQGNLSSCLNGSRNYTGGFEWKYYSEVIDINSIEGKETNS